jgi:hypothetical protein
MTIIINIIIISIIIIIIITIIIITRLLDRCLVDPRYTVPIARDAFGAALSVLVFPEGWSAGLEWDLIDLLLDIYLLLVLGR